MTARLQRRAGIVVATLAALAPSHVAVAPGADASIATTIAIATWATPAGGSSACSNLGSVSVHCKHDYSSLDKATGLDTCSELGLRAVGITTCRVALAGGTSGPGRVVGETVTVCGTSGFHTLHFAFGGLTGTFPGFSVSGTVEDGLGTFAGTSDPVLVPGVGVVVQSAGGTFTFGCGPGEPERGSFTGSWTLTIG